MLARDPPRFFGNNAQALSDVGPALAQYRQNTAQIKARFTAALDDSAAAIARSHWLLDRIDRERPISWWPLR